MDTYAQVTGFSVHSQVLSGPFSVCVAFSTLTRSALCIRINLIDVHESVSLSLNRKVLGGLSKRVTLQRFCSLSLSAGENALIIPTQKLNIYDVRENESNFTGATEGGSFQMNQKTLYF